MGTRIAWTDVDIECVLDGKLAWAIPWAEILRIGWVTEDTGIAITDDHFLAIQAGTCVSLFSYAAEGVPELAKEVERRFPPTMGPRGTLCNVVGDDSVVIWPPSEAGEDLWALVSVDHYPHATCRHACRYS